MGHGYYIRSSVTAAFWLLGKRLRLRFQFGGWLSAVGNLTTRLVFGHAFAQMRFDSTAVDYHFQAVDRFSVNLTFLDGLADVLVSFSLF